MQFKGTAHRYGRDIDTDVIIPARYLTTSDPAELAKHCLEDLDTSFVERVQPGDIIVADENFGCGSSREHAPIAIKAAGVDVVIAKSFARIFYRNSINTGLAIMECPEAVDAISQGDVVNVDADAGVIVAEQASPELGRVGRITRINSPLLDDLVAGDYIPVVASVALGEDGGFYNVNADMVAGHIAAAIGAHKVVFLTDVDGLYENFENKDSLISNLTLFEAQYMVENNIVSTGMIPKLKSCIHALDSGVFRAHIINGITPHSLLLELLTSTGVGTTMHSTEESCTFDTHPLGNFASKLLENRQHAASATPNNKIF